jgi:hypothetical protein
MQSANSFIDGSYQDLLHAVQADRIVGSLQTQQHLRPHQALNAAVAAAQLESGFCERAGEMAMAVLHLDPQRKIGRLRSCELAQLARTIHRLWQPPVPA